MTATVRPFPRRRRQTYVFLRDARQTCHVYLTADVDATKLRAARVASGGKLSYVSFVIKAAADVIARYPDARSVLKGGWRPRLTVIDDVHAKLILDKTIDGQRCIVSGTLLAAQDRSILEVQDFVDTYKNAPVDEHGPYAKLLRLQRLPLPLMRLLYRAMIRDGRRRLALQGTFAVTSLGHAPVRTFLPMISGTLGFGVGQIADTAVVRDGQITVAPVFNLALVFDHRVIDGAMAAEILMNVKNRLENWELP